MIRRATAAELLGAVNQYADLGWQIVPLHEVLVGGGCSCGRDCGTSAGKHPRPNRWQDVATANPTTLRGWWARTPLANIGMKCGSASELVGVDIDPPNGEACLLALSDGDLPPTLEMMTGKGRRLLYAIPDSLEFEPRTVCFKDGEDHETIRLQGGANADGEPRGYQCVLPPSWHPSGKRYEWVSGRGPGEIAPAPMPGWAVLLMSPPPEPTWADQPREPVEADADTPWVQFNARADWWGDIIAPQGARPAGTRGEIQYATRPGKKGGVSASIGFHRDRAGNPCLHVFSGNWPALQPDRTYDKAGAFARIYHRGDFAAAARDMLARGFSAIRSPPDRAGQTSLSIEERLKKIERENWEMAREIATLRKQVEAFRGR